MPIGTEQQKKQTQDRLISVGRKRLGDGPIRALRAILGMGAVAKSAGLSKDAARQAFRTESTVRSGPKKVAVPGRPDDDAFIMALTSDVMDPSAYQGLYALLGVASEGAATLTNATDRERLEYAISIVEPMVKSQFTMDGYCTRWLLHSAAMPASHLFPQNDMTDPDRALAQNILSTRRKAYQELSVGNADQIKWVMSVLHRRPLPGMDPMLIGELMHALLDGAVLRMAIEPDLFTCRLVAEAMVRLGLALSEPGGVKDPRRPQDDGKAALFDYVVKAAIEMWKDAPERLNNVGSAAARAEETHPGALPAGWEFPSIGDLADSAIRFWVDAAGKFSDIDTSISLSESAAALQRQAALTGLDQTLGRLTAAQKQIKQAFRVVEASPPLVGEPFLDALQRGVARIVLDAESSDRNSAEGQRGAASTARDLIQAARNGDEDLVQILLRDVGYIISPAP